MKSNMEQDYKNRKLEAFKQANLNLSRFSFPFASKEFQFIRSNFRLPFHQYSQDRRSFHYIQFPF
jgi:hypothetical protein